MSEEEQELTTSEEYETSAIESIAEGDKGMAQAYSTLALMATIRESTFIIAELIDPSDDEVDDDA